MVIGKGQCYQEGLVENRKKRFSSSSHRSSFGDLEYMGCSIEVRLGRESVCEKQCFRLGNRKKGMKRAQG